MKIAWKNKKIWLEILIIVLLLALFIAPRAIDLDRFITIDEGLWMYHSSQFYYALGQREFDNTYQRFHPGVTMMWAGALGFQIEFPEFRGLGQGYIDSGLKLGDFLEKQGKSPLDLVVAGRAFMIAQNALLFLLAYWVLRQVFPIGVAASILGIVCCEPFFVSLTYILQMDGLMASYMFVSILSLLVYLYGGKNSPKEKKNNIFFLLSAVMAGAGVLTKAPAAFLFPFTGLMLLINWIEQKDFSWDAFLKRLVFPFIVWSLVAILVMIVLWPALWNNPIGMVDKILAKSSERLSEGIGFRLFFDGQTLNGRDYPWYFYPISFAWRSSPIVLIGLIAAAVTGIKQWGIFEKKKSRRLLIGLVLSAVIFTLEMGLGAMKMDRYIIPVHLLLATASVMGWFALSQKVASFSLRVGKPERMLHRSLLLFVLILLPLQLSQLAATYPYYFAYYNPLLGGTERAENIFWLGWGEGLEQVAEYLNEKPDAKNLSVMSLHAYGPLSYYFEGETQRKPWMGELTFESIQDLDYMVIYVSERQTNIHPAMLTVLDSYEPEFVANINGVDYARLYNMHEISSEDWRFLRKQLPAD